MLAILPGCDRLASRGRASTRTDLAGDLSDADFLRPGSSDCHNRIRRHSSGEMKPPIAYEIIAARAADAVDEEQAA
jgi:hypothetical protein